MRIYLNLQRATFKKMQMPGYDYIDRFLFKKLHPSVTDSLCNWVNDHKKEAFVEGWQNVNYLNPRRGAFQAVIDQ